MKNIYSIKTNENKVNNKSMLQLTRNYPKIKSNKLKLLITDSSFFPMNQSLITVTLLTKNQFSGYFMILVEGGITPFCLVCKIIADSIGFGEKGLMLVHRYICNISVLDITVNRLNEIFPHLIVFSSGIRFTILKIITDRIMSDPILKNKMFPFYWSGDASNIKNFILIGGPTSIISRKDPYKLKEWIIEINRNPYWFIQFSHPDFGVYKRDIKFCIFTNIIKLNYSILTVIRGPNIHYNFSYNDMVVIIEKLSLQYIEGKPMFTICKKSMK